MLTFPRAPLSGSDFAPRLQSQTLPDPGCQPSPPPHLATHANHKATAPPVSWEYASLLTSPLVAGPGPETLSSQNAFPIPHFPYSATPKQLLASTLHAFWRRSECPRFSEVPLSPFPRFDRGPPISHPTAARRVAGAMAKCSEPPCMHTQNPTDFCSPIVPNTLDFLK